jgi:N-acetylated-alpha-linked acidic dipeptidase
MRDLVLSAAGEVSDPRSGRTLKELWLDRRREAWAASGPIDLDPAIWSGSKVEGKDPDRPAFAPQMHPLGSGSDYTAFVDHLGIPAVDVNFSGRYGVYHAVYDNFYWMENFGDPGFQYHATAARLYTLIAMRAAGAEVAPLRFGAYGEALRELVDDARRLLIRKRRGLAPVKIAEIPGLAELGRAVTAFGQQAAALDQAVAALTAQPKASGEKLEALNAALTRVERAFLAPEGLPGRAWYRHTIYAPGLTTGYAAWPLPGVRRAILEDDPAMVAAQVPVLVRQIDAATAVLTEAVNAARAAAAP